MKLKRLTVLAVTFVIAGVAVAPPCAAVSYTTWHFTGRIDSVGENSLGFPVPLGAPVAINITFNPLTPNSNGVPFPGCGCGPGIGDYRMEGGPTDFQVTIGSHVSSPIPKYRLTVVPAEFYASDDQFNFLSYESNGIRMNVDIPGFLTGGTVQLFFGGRHTPGPIVSPVFPLTQPDPLHFSSARIFFQKGTSRGSRVIFSASLDGLSVPEPGAATFGGLSLAFVATRRRLRKRGDR
ncbi:MAG: hypothetical protein H0T51_23685 [Pirellulales bacterium]|nr:hypothetical protein [Pirellulales bacterium]